MDFFDVIVHVMRTDVREKYDLEGLWGDAGQGGAPGGPKSASRRGRPRDRATARGKAAGKTQREDGSPALDFDLTNPRRGLAPGGTGAPSGGPDYALLFLDGNFRRGPDHVIQHFAELVQAGGGDDDVVPAAIDVFGDAQEPAARDFPSV